MRISRVHVEAKLVVGDKITFDKDRAHYLKHVLRLKPGAAVDLFNGDGNDYRATLTVDGKHLGAVLESLTPKDTESPIQTTLVQAIGKSDHLDWMLQKTTELGVNRIILFNAEHTQFPIKSTLAEKKHQHWRAVAISACEQCGRSRVPEILFFPGLQEAIKPSMSDLNLILDFDGEPIAARASIPTSSIAILAGPEGGLNRAELETAIGAGFQTASLGPRILRFETAALAALAIVQSALVSHRH